MKPDEENEEDGIELECDWTLKPVFVSKVFIMDELLVNQGLYLVVRHVSSFLYAKSLAQYYAIDFNVIGNDGNTPLHHACMHGQVLFVSSYFLLNSV